MSSLATPAFGFANTKAAFNTGVRPKIAINDLGVFVTTFSDLNNKLYYAIGTVAGVRVQLQEAKKLQSGDGGHDGYVPAVAMNQTVVVEMHVNNKDKHDLYYSTGVLSGAPGSMTVSWSKTKRYDDGEMPALSNIDGDRLIEFHTSNGSSKIYYHVGTVSTSGVEWADGGSKVVNYAGDDIKGDNVSAQLDGSRVVIAYQHDDHLYYAIGTLGNDSISWLCNVRYDDGHAPSVVLKDDLVYEFHEGDKEKLWQRVGRITVSGSAPSIEWQNWLGQTHGSESLDQYSYEYDVQYVPAVAGAGNLMVQVCAGGDEQKLKSESNPSDYHLYCSASRLINRGRWMGDNITALKTMTLRDIAMPASHDAGMYTGNMAKLARTQNLDFLGQCLTGSRYFDIRPTFSHDQYYCYHQYDSTMLGATIDDALTDFTEFLTDWSSQELLILKLSHYGNGMIPSPDDIVFMGLIDKITTALGDWLVAPPAAGQRFADIDLAALIGDKGGVLVVCDGLVSGKLGDKKIYAYRDWQSSDPQNGDLTVFDIYSDTTDLDEMMNGTDPAHDHKGPDIPYLPNGQIPKWQGPGPAGQHYAGFAGTCYNTYNGTDVPCDMFLLSWTLTPFTDVWDESQKANGALVDNIPTGHTNGLGRAINLIYVDYVSYSHATDVACVRNGFVT